MSKNPLQDARDYMLEHGWCQFTRQDDDGRVCLFGAIDSVIYHTLYDTMINAEVTIRRAIKQLSEEGAIPRVPMNLMNDKLLPIPAVNDEVLIHQDQALAVLDRAAKIWEQERS